MKSSRFPGKPMKKILDIPMIEHVYKRVKMCKVKRNGGEVVEMAVTPVPHLLFVLLRLEDRVRVACVLRRVLRWLIWMAPRRVAFGEVPDLLADA